MLLSVVGHPAPSPGDRAKEPDQSEPELNNPNHWIHSQYQAEEEYQISPSMSGVSVKSRLICDVQVLFFRAMSWSAKTSNRSSIAHMTQWNEYLSSFFTPLSLALPLSGTTYSLYDHSLGTVTNTLEVPDPN